MRLTQFVRLAAFGAGLMLACAAQAQTAKAPAPALDKAAVEKIVREYLLAHPELLEEMGARLEMKQANEQDKVRNDALAKVGRKALVDPKVAFVTGPANAKVTIAEFFDYRCPHCKASTPAVKAITARNDVRIAFIEMPILTADSLLAAKAAVAARKQGKYLPFHFALMATAGELPKDRILTIAKSVGLDTVKLAADMDAPDVTASLKASNQLAENLHFDGTPIFVINDTIVVGEVTAEEMANYIQTAKN